MAKDVQSPTILYQNIRISEYLVSPIPFLASIIFPKLFAVCSSNNSLLHLRPPFGCNYSASS